MVRAVQRALNNAGYDCGIADGISGPKTKKAIEDYQKANEQPVTGLITDDLLKALDIEPDKLEDEAYTGGTAQADYNSGVYTYPDDTYTYYSEPDTSSSYDSGYDYDYSGYDGGNSGNNSGDSGGGSGSEDGGFDLSFSF